MITIHKSKPITVKWSIWKSLRVAKETFGGAKIVVFLVAPCDKIPVNATIDEDGDVSFLIDGNRLVPDVYSIQAIWIKNQGRYVGRHTCRCKNGEEFMVGNINESNLDRAFEITDYQEEETPNIQENPVLRFNTSVASYGYDGLSAYELCVLHGKYNGTEDEFTDLLMGNLGN